MKTNQRLLLMALPLLTVLSITSCGKNKNSSVVESSKWPLEIGDTVKEWKSTKNYDGLPIESAETRSTGEIDDTFGNDDKCSLKYDVQHSNKKDYLGSDVLKTPYFIEDDAKNGDIISLYVYVPSGSNVASLQLEVLPSSMNNGIKSDLLTVDDTKEKQWIRLMASFDTLETLGAIRLNYVLVDNSYRASFYVDDINITLGAETVKTDYEYKEESLYTTYQDYFKVGTCMSASGLRNTTLRKIAIDNFNTITAENECKPQHVLDEKASKQLVGADPTAVAIKTDTFEKLFNFCEAHHIGVRYHTLVWYSQIPAWFFKVGYNANGNNASKEVMLGRMENFIKVTLETVNNRWPGLVYAIDAANEGVKNGSVRTIGDNNETDYWYNIVGIDAYYYAFKYARQYAKPEQKLYYNDYSFDYNTQNLNYALNTLLKKAIAEGLVDGVGIQGHLDYDQNMDTIINDAKMIKQKGLECQITELDITTNGTSTSDYNKQKKAYNTLVTKVLQNNAKGNTNVNAIVVWGITDDSSWKRNQNPLLFTSKYGKKAAYYGFLEAISAVQPTEGA